MNINRNQIRKKAIRSYDTKQSITIYDADIGVIRIIDTSVDSNAPPSLSPIKLNRSLRRNIKKPVLAKNV